MKGTYSALMQSKFFNPAFNSAIFDGPLRIYFAQSHEALALKVYFNFQQKFLSEMNRAKELHKFVGRNVLLMLYPTKESFEHSFEAPQFVVSDVLSDDTIIGVAGPYKDEELDQILEAVLAAFRSWEKIPFEKPADGATL